MTSHGKSATSSVGAFESFMRPSYHNLSVQNDPKHQYSFIENSYVDDDKYYESISFDIEQEEKTKLLYYKSFLDNILRSEEQ